MKKIYRLFLLIALLLTLPACASQAEPTPSVAQPIQVNLATVPDPPQVGDVELRFTVLDQNGNPLQGASVEAHADHIDMTGMEMSGAATEQGGGVYAITANFSMSGNWKITVSVRQGELEAQQEFRLVVK